MPRTTAEAVGGEEGIIEVDDSISLEPFIEAANELVTEICAAVMQDDGVTPFHSNSRLELIERWLSAHFYAVRDPRAHVEQVGLIRSHFESKVEYGLKNTRYGQQALRFDTSGALAAFDNALETTKQLDLPGVEEPGKKVKVRWLGST